MKIISGALMVIKGIQKNNNLYHYQGHTVIGTAATVSSDAKETEDKQDDHSIVGYCDSDYAGYLDKRQSTTGYVFTLAKAPVSWRSTLQSTVALFTIEAKYMAVTEAMKELLVVAGRVAGADSKQQQACAVVAVIAAKLGAGRSED
ncbi:uncharacterized protein LOC131167456 [Malania oleifera]|uniref:uncharacterized protein LOC131167456 n=1 Tax=Malania oleifera TaxID=397392 RepID=UPI0025AE9E63|nr:uncharacterized protein LOC131167456 [Malania oleifera]